MSELETLLSTVSGDDEWARHQALAALRSRGAPPGRVDAIAAVLAGDEAGRRSAARDALAALASPDSPASDYAGRALTDALRSSDHDLRILAASAIGETANPALAPALVGALGDDDPNVVAAAADALAELGHPRAVEPLGALVSHPSPWVALAAVVALGRLRDPRGLPPLAAASAEPGLRPAVAEAVRRISDPAGLSVLERIVGSAPEHAVAAAGAILAANPDIAAPAWVAEHARSLVDRLIERLVEDDDPGIARLVGLAATPTAVRTLVELAGPPRRSEAAVVGILAVPGPRRVDPILHRLDGADPDDAAALLALLPPLHDPDPIERIVRLLAHESATVRGAAAEALARSPADRSLTPLARALESEPTPEVVRAMGGLGSAACVALVPLLEDVHPSVRAAAADALARCGGTATAGDLEAALDRETDPAARRSLLAALGVVAAERALPILREALADPDAETRVAAIEALGSSGVAGALPLLEDRLDGPPAERLAAIRALGELGAAAAAAALEPALTAPDVEVRRAAARALIPMARAVDLATTSSLARDPDPSIRRWAARMLGHQGPGAREVLDALAGGDPDPEVRAEALRALDRSG